jgi:anti-anti-sigma factor
MLECFTFKVAGEAKESYRIKVLKDLLSENAIKFRHTINHLVESEYENIYIDLKELSNFDLISVNEIINASYLLKNVSKRIFLLYKQQSEIEKWVTITGLDTFIEPAITPPNAN